MQLPETGNPVFIKQLHEFKGYMYNLKRILVSKAWKVATDAEAILKTSKYLALILLKITYQLEIKLFYIEFLIWYLNFNGFFF